jgi:hypothetical protein
MQVSFTEWEPVVPTDADDFLVQNVGSNTIGFMFGTTEPLPNLATHLFGRLYTGSEPRTFTGVDTAGLTLYVKALGPKLGELFVS